MSSSETQRPTPQESGARVPPGSPPPTAVGAGTPPPPEPERPRAQPSSRRSRRKRRSLLGSLLNAAMDVLDEIAEIGVKLAKKL